MLHNTFLDMIKYRIRCTNRSDGTISYMAQCRQFYFWWDLQNYEFAGPFGLRQAQDKLQDVKKSMNDPKKKVEYIYD